MAQRCTRNESPTGPTPGHDHPATVCVNPTHPSTGIRTLAGCRHQQLANRPHHSITARPRAHNSQPSTGGIPRQFPRLQPDDRAVPTAALTANPAPLKPSRLHRLTEHFHPPQLRDTQATLPADSPIRPARCRAVSPCSGSFRPEPATGRVPRRGPDCRPTFRRIADSSSPWRRLWMAHG
jgi:hypothetical protein